MKKTIKNKTIKKTEIIEIILVRLKYHEMVFELHLMIEKIITTYFSLKKLYLTTN